MADFFLCAAEPEPEPEEEGPDGSTEYDTDPEHDELDTAALDALDGALQDESQAAPPEEEGQPEEGEPEREPEPEPEAEAAPAPEPEPEAEPEANPEAEPEPEPEAEAEEEERASQAPAELGAQEALESEATATPDQAEADEAPAAAEEEEEEAPRRRVSIVTPEEEEVVLQAEELAAAAAAEEHEEHEEHEKEEKHAEEEEDPFQSYSESDVEVSASDLDLWSESDPEVEIEPVAIAGDAQQYVEWAEGATPRTLELSMTGGNKLTLPEMKSFCEYLGATNRGKSANAALLRAALERAPFLAKYFPDKRKSALSFTDVTHLFECAKAGRRVDYPAYPAAALLPTFISCPEHATKANLPFRPILFVHLAHARTAQWTTFTLVSGYGTSRKTVQRTYADFLLLDEALKKTHRADNVLPDIPDPIQAMDDTTEPTAEVSRLVNELQAYITAVVAYTASVSVTWWELFGWLGWSQFDMVHVHIEDMKLLTEEVFSWGLQADPAEPLPATFAVSEFWLGTVKQLFTLSPNSPEYGRIPFPMDNTFIAETESLRDGEDGERKSTDASPRWKAGDIAMIVGLDAHAHLNDRLVSVTSTLADDRVNICIPSADASTADSVNHHIIRRANLAPPVFAEDKFGQAALPVVECVKGPQARVVKKDNMQVRIHYHNVTPALFHLLAHVYGYPLHRIMHHETTPLVSSWSW